MTMYWFECVECGYDSDESGKLSPSDNMAICPLCAGDTGRDVDLKFRLATPEEIKRFNGLPG